MRLALQERVEVRLDGRLVDVTVRVDVCLTHFAVSGAAIDQQQHLMRRGIVPVGRQYDRGQHLGPVVRRYGRVATHAGKATGAAPAAYAESSKFR